MPNRIHIVEHPRIPVGLPGDSVQLPAEWDCAKRTCWEHFAPEQLRHCDDRLLIANAGSGPAEARQFFHWLRDHTVPCPVIAIVPQLDLEMMRAAAETVDDFSVWPARGEELTGRIARLLGSEPPWPVAAEPRLDRHSSQLVGEDPSLQKVIGQIRLYARSEAPVLITGETGTGKELCARVLHIASSRAQGPFIPVDCGALPDHLFENEVFGHARGAYTDARSEQKGLAALAEGGTLFLDEIDSLSSSAQSKVLRLLQERTYRPLGGEDFKRANLRILAATNRNLEQLVNQKAFRADLLYRVNVLRIKMPPLRERRADLPLLSRHFVDEICASERLPRKILSVAATRKLEGYEWPGNVRELYNTLQRAVLCSPGLHIAASLIELNNGQAAEEALDFRSAKRSAIQQFERQYVLEMMDRNGGNVTRAAREAGQDRRAFGRLAKKHQVRGQFA